MATLTAQSILHTGLKATYSSAAALGDETEAGSRRFLHVKNGSGAPITVTLTTPNTVDGLAIADAVSTVTNAEEEFIGPLETRLYGETVAIAYSSETTVTIAVIAV